MSSECNDDKSYFANVSGTIDLHTVNKWKRKLDANKINRSILSDIVKAFSACLSKVKADHETQVKKDCIIDNNAVFNSVIQLCVTSLYPALSAFLKLPSDSVTKKQIENSRKWPRVKNCVLAYVTNIIELSKNVTSETIIKILLKHLHQMIPFVACSPSVSKEVIKQLILFWSTSNDDTVRVIAFICILHFATSDISLYLHNILKKMYMNYISNCQFISQNTISSVNFMKKSLSELFLLNETIAYNHAFMFIRQLAIHLRSAITLKQKENIQAVYNWKYISSLKLWVDVLCSAKDKKLLNSLIYPTTQIIIGVIKLVPTAQYFPLRFHCIKLLIKLSKENDLFIPIIPFLLETMVYLNNFKQHKKLSMKPLEFDYILRLSKSQLQENAFKDTVIDQLYECILEYVEAESYRLSFPDTVVVLQIQMKQFIKESKNINYNRKLKPLLEKIEEVSKSIRQERNKSNVSLSDENAILAWENNMKLKSNPLIILNKSLQAVNSQKAKRKTENEIIVSN